MQQQYAHCPSHSLPELRVSQLGQAHLNWLAAQYQAAHLRSSPAPAQEPAGWTPEPVLQQYVGHRVCLGTLLQSVPGDSAAEMDLGTGQLLIAGAACPAAAAAPVALLSADAAAAEQTPIEAHLAAAEVLAAVVATRPVTAAAAAVAAAEMHGSAAAVMVAILAQPLVVALAACSCWMSVQCLTTSRFWPTRPYAGAATACLHDFATYLMPVFLAHKWVTGRSNMTALCFFVCIVPLLMRCARH
jgi:hypothetical protein